MKKETVVQSVLSISRVRVNDDNSSSRTQLVDPGSMLVMAHAIVLSILFHVLIIAGFIFHFQVNKISVGSGVILKAYVYHVPFLIKKTLKIASTSSVVRQNSKLLQNGHLLSQSHNNIGENSLAQNESVGKYDSLAIVLHNLVQQQINISDTLSVVAQNKKVGVTFTLFPDGHIESVNIVRSSGVLLLDNLARNAVLSIQPVHMPVKLSYRKIFFLTFCFL